jgi:uncharacterized protein YkwD
MINSIKNTILPLVIIVLLSCSKPIMVNSTPLSDHSRDGETSLIGMEKNILYYINQHRRSIGLSDLIMLEQASQKATEHSMDMAKRKTGFGHEGFDTRVKYIAKNTGAVSAAAENIAYGQLSAKEVVDGWLHSPGHKRNIEGNYTYTGIGLAKDRDGVIYFTQIFIRK